ncbi:protein ORF68 [Cyprinid herpesvirus 3]|uniref:Protein ORF68 n=1 Tax=Cyprinid herpesvirus 3 TaxID=180230 RepID=A3QTM7_CYHV3|nr:unnamed protein product [Cyprinid herpesvirus 3]ABG42895.1 protein ORF68 [Cyprinid herpesvirus 3]
MASGGPPQSGANANDGVRDVAAEVNRITLLENGVAQFLGLPPRDRSDTLQKALEVIVNDATLEPETMVKIFDTLNAYVLPVYEVCNKTLASTMGAALYYNKIKSPLLPVKADTIFEFITTLQEYLKLDMAEQLTLKTQVQKQLDAMQASGAKSDRLVKDLQTKLARAQQTEKTNAEALERLGQVSTQVAAMQQQQTALAEQVKAKDAAIDNLQQQLALEKANANKSSQEVRQSYDEALKAARDALTKSAQDTADTVDQVKAAAAKELDACKASLDDITGKYTALLKSNEKLVKSSAAVTRELQEAQKMCTLASGQQDHAELRIKELEEQAAASTSLLDTARLNYQQLEDQFKQTTAELAGIKADAQSVADAIKAANDEHQKTKDALAHTQSAYDLTMEQVNEYQAKLQASEAALKEAHDTAKANMTVKAQSRISELEAEAVLGRDTMKVKDAEVRDLKTKLASAKNETAAALSRLADKEDEIETLAKTLADAVESAKQQNETIGRNAAESIKDLALRLKRQEELAKDAEANLANVTRDLERRMKEQAEEYNNNELNYAAALTALQQSSKELEQQLADARRQLAQAQAQAQAQAAQPQPQPPAQPQAAAQPPAQPQAAQAPAQPQPPAQAQPQAEQPPAAQPQAQAAAVIAQGVTEAASVADDGETPMEEIEPPEYEPPAGGVEYEPDMEIEMPPAAFDPEEYRKSQERKKLEESARANPNLVRKPTPKVNMFDFMQSIKKPVPETVEALKARVKELEMMLKLVYDELTRVNAERYQEAATRCMAAENFKRQIKDLRSKNVALRDKLEEARLRFELDKLTYENDYAKQMYKFQENIKVEYKGSVDMVDQLKRENSRLESQITSGRTADDNFYIKSVDAVKKRYDLEAKNMTQKYEVDLAAEKLLFEREFSNRSKEVAELRKLYEKEMRAYKRHTESLFNRLRLDYLKYIIKAGIAIGKKELDIIIKDQATKDFVDKAKLQQVQREGPEATLKYLKEINGWDTPTAELNLPPRNPKNLPQFVVVVPRNDDDRQRGPGRMPSDELATTIEVLDQEELPEDPDVENKKQREDQMQRLNAQINLARLQRKYDKTAILSLVPARTSDQPIVEGDPDFKFVHNPVREREIRERLEELKRDGLYVETGTDTELVTPDVDELDKMISDELSTIGTAGDSSVRVGRPLWMDDLQTATGANKVQLYFRVGEPAQSPIPIPDNTTPTGGLHNPLNEGPFFRYGRTGSKTVHAKDLYKMFAIKGDDYLRRYYDVELAIEPTIRYNSKNDADITKFAHKLYVKDTRATLMPKLMLIEPVEYTLALSRIRYYDQVMESITTGRSMPTKSQAVQFVEDVGQMLQGYTGYGINTMLHFRSLYWSHGWANEVRNNLTVGGYRGVEEIIDSDVKRVTMLTMKNLCYFSREAIYMFPELKIDTDKHYDKLLECTRNSRVSTMFTAHRFFTSQVLTVMFDCSARFGYNTDDYRIDLAVMDAYFTILDDMVAKGTSALNSGDQLTTAMRLANLGYCKHFMLWLCVLADVGVSLYWLTPPSWRTFIRRLPPRWGSEYNIFPYSIFATNGATLTTTIKGAMNRRTRDPDGFLRDVLKIKGEKPDPAQRWWMKVLNAVRLTQQLRNVPLGSSEGWHFAFPHYNQLNKPLNTLFQTITITAAMGQVDDVVMSRELDSVQMDSDAVQRGYAHQSRIVMAATGLSTAQISELLDGKPQVIRKMVDGKVAEYTVTAADLNDATSNSYVMHTRFPGELIIPDDAVTQELRDREAFLAATQSVPDIDTGVGAGPRPAAAAGAVGGGGGGAAPVVEDTEMLEMAVDEGAAPPPPPANVMSIENQVQIDQANQAAAAVASQPLPREDIFEDALEEMEVGPSTSTAPAVPPPASAASAAAAVRTRINRNGPGRRNGNRNGNRNGSNRNGNGGDRPGANAMAQAAINEQQIAHRTVEAVAAADVDPSRTMRPTYRDLMQCLLTVNSLRTQPNEPTVDEMSRTTSRLYQALLNFVVDWCSDPFVVFNFPRPPTQFPQVPTDYAKLEKSLANWALFGGKVKFGLSAGDIGLAKTQGLLNAANTTFRVRHMQGVSGSLDRMLGAAAAAVDERSVKACFRPNNNYPGRCVGVKVNDLMGIREKRYLLHALAPKLDRLEDYKPDVHDDCHAYLMWEMVLECIAHDIHSLTVVLVGGNRYNNPPQRIIPAQIQALMHALYTLGSQLPSNLYINFCLDKHLHEYTRKILNNIVSVMPSTVQPKTTKAFVKQLYEILPGPRGPNVASGQS